MKKLFGLIISLCFSVAMTAQPASPVLVISTMGKVDYFKKNNKKGTRLLPMQKLDVDGKIKVEKKSSVKLLFKNRSYKLNTPGTYLIEELVRPEEKIKTQSFTSRFWTFINSGLQSSGDKNALENYHHEYMEQSTGGISGFGENREKPGKAIPGPGILSAGAIHFQWPQIPSLDRYYQFIIQQAETDEINCYVHTRDSFLSIYLDQIYLEPGKVYFWTVSCQEQFTDTKKRENEPIVVVGKIPFRYQADLNPFIQPKLALLKDYKDASNWEKMWMEAIVMEQEGFYYDSEKRYQGMLVEDPDDIFIKIMYSTFLARQGKMDRALRFIE